MYKATPSIDLKVIKANTIDVPPGTLGYEVFATGAILDWSDIRLAEMFIP